MPIQPSGRSSLNARHRRMHECFVVQLWSDNGTNFIWAKSELEEALVAVKKEKIHGVLKQVGNR